MKKIIKFSLILIFSLIIINEAQSQYILQRSVFGNGGKAVSNSALKLNSTLGQAIVGIVQNNDIIGKFGFWYTIPESSTSQIIQLNSGWNIISSYMYPEAPLMPGVFSEIVTNVNLVKNGIGQTYIPAFNINDIGEWNIAHGYQVNMLNSAVLEISGTTVIPEETPIDLIQGWNLTSYLRNNAMSPVQAFASIGTSLFLAKNNAGGLYIPSWGINSLGNLSAGEGYFLYLNTASELTYPANNAQKSLLYDYVTPSVQYLIPNLTPTGNSASLLIQINAADGSEVAVFTKNNELIGSAYLSGGVAAVNIWGDDFLTEKKEAAADGDLLFVKLFSPKTNELVNLNLYQINEMISNKDLDELVYSQNAIYNAKGVIEGAEQLVMQISNTPNPVSNSTFFEFSLENDGNAEILIYALDGKIVSKVNSSFYKAGTFKVAFDASGLTSGAYTVVLRSGSQTAMTMMIIEK
ncbi:MAG TPA: T9SS type A sorting domain-containing protein [Candidatus Kapabacteria bacterium]|nr:T9SS type A sorting domain-containing protein [Candidatus Kapabacteria bacterium]HPO64181.1 T9SS type A sorting domain-containing protein [Candidatus Kapabacteria bacterium]